MVLYDRFQVPLAQPKIMENCGEVMTGIGYRYKNENGDKCVEYHVDDLLNELYKGEIYLTYHLVEP